VKVSEITAATAIAVGSAHTCALTAAGAIYCWGANGASQAGVRLEDSERCPDINSGRSSCTRKPRAVTY